MSANTEKKKWEVKCLCLFCGTFHRQHLYMFQHVSACFDSYRCMAEMLLCLMSFTWMFSFVWMFRWQWLSDGAWFYMCLLLCYVLCVSRCHPEVITPPASCNPLIDPLLWELIFIWAESTKSNFHWLSVKQIWEAFLNVITLSAS